MDVGNCSCGLAHLWAWWWTPVRSEVLASGFLIIIMQLPRQVEISFIHLWCLDSFSIISWVYNNACFHLHLSSSFWYFFAVLNCVKIAKLQNGQVNIRSTQGIAEYECNTGYELVGENVRKCQVNGDWSGTPPQCIGKIIWPHTIILQLMKYNVILIA